jgi:hypothetical protein
MSQLSRDSENALVQETSNGSTRSYRFSVLLCNEALECISAEAARGQVAGGLDAVAAPLCQLCRTLALGRERFEGRLDVLCRNSSALEVVADQSIAGAAGSELLRPRTGEALHGNRSARASRHLLPLGCLDAPLLEALGETPRSSSRGDAAHGQLDGIIALGPSAEAASSCPARLLDLIDDRRTRGAGGGRQPRRDRLSGPACS